MLGVELGVELGVAAGALALLSVEPPDDLLSAVAAGLLESDEESEDDPELGLA